MSSDDCRPRYCFLEKSQIGYGFNLHGEEPRNDEMISELTTFYHVIKSVDANSPASFGGLKQDDRLIGVNGYYVDTKPHNEVVRLIRSGGSSTWLLVVDKETDEYYFRVAQRKPTFSDSVYGQEDKRGEPVDQNEVPMEEDREEINSNGSASAAAAASEGEDVEDGPESNRSEKSASVEVEAIAHPPVPARRSRDTDSEEEEVQQEHRSQEEEEAVNALVDAVNQNDICGEEEEEDNKEEEEEEETSHHLSSNNRVSHQSHADDGEVQTLSYQARGSYYHFQERTPEMNEIEEEEKDEASPAPTPVVASPEEGSSEKNIMFLNMQSAREAARGKRNAAKTAGNWATKYEDFKRL